MESNHCFICGSPHWLERHHIFGGAYRKKSEKDGLVVHLCHYCHNEPPYGAHFCAETMLALRKYGQRIWMQEHNASVGSFIKRYGKNYLDADESELNEEIFKLRLKEIKSGGD